MLYLKSLTRSNLVLALTLATGLVACGGAEKTPDEPVEEPPVTQDQGPSDDGPVDAGDDSQVDSGDVIEEPPIDADMETGDDGQDAGVPSDENPFSPELTGLQTNFEFMHDGLARKFHFYAPEGLIDGEAYPLVMLMHGHGGSSDQMLGLSGMKAPYRIWLDIAEREKVFILVPEGVISPDDKLGWNDCRADTVTNPSTDDVGFLVGLSEAMADVYPIDENRFYASGTSNGGHMSLRLAIEAGEHFAAVAPLLAALPTDSNCSEPDTQVALMLINGTNDEILPYDGGQVAGSRGGVFSTLDTIATWRTLNQNTAEASVGNLPDINTEDESTVVRTDYAGPTQLQDVTLVTIDGGGHTVPSIEEQYSNFYERMVGTQNHDVEMAELVWGFLKDKAR